MNESIFKKNIKIYRFHKDLKIGIKNITFVLERSTGVDWNAI